MASQSLHLTINKLWYGGNKLAYLLTPLSSVFSLMSSIRKHKQQSKQIKFQCPVIIVGNITVGGTGKTPMVITLANELHQHGFKIGIASRGYKSQAVQPVLVNELHTVAEVGDETLLIFRNAQTPIMVGNNRVSVIQALIDKCRCDLVICDDGLQDYRFNHDVEIIMVDGERVFGNQQLLPAGPLRENISRLQQADFVVASSKVIPAISNDYMKLNLNEAVNLLNGEVTPISYWQNETVHAIAGIGNPSRFFNALRAQNLNIIEHEFPDHAMLNKQDVTFSDQKPVLMTEKDAVKCRDYGLNNLWFIPMQVELPQDFISRVVQKLK